MTDFVFMVEDTSYMFITGPDVVKTVTGENVTQQELGGAIAHASKSGVCHFTSADDAACLDDVRYLLGYLPSNNLEEAPVVATDDDPGRLCPELRDIIPASSNQPYDMTKVIEAVVDDGEYFEYARRWAPNIVCAYARLDGHVVGIVGNQPMHLAGVLDIESSEKAARFVRTCDAFNIPLHQLRRRARASCPASTRSTAASSATAPSCSTPSASRPSPASRSSPARPTAAPTW